MARAMRAERERACDDHVLAAGTKASDYAHELLDIVSGLREPELAAALAMARRSQLEGRVLAVLNPAVPRGSVSRRAALIFAVLTLGVVLPLSALRPAQQAGTPAAKSTQKKPSPASTPAIAPDAKESATPGAAASTPSPSDVGGARQGAEADPKLLKRRKHPSQQRPLKLRSRQKWHKAAAPGCPCNTCRARGSRSTGRSRCSGRSSGACGCRWRSQRVRNPRQAPPHEHGVQRRQ